MPTKQQIIASKKNIIRIVMRRDAEEMIQIFAQDLANGEYDDVEDPNSTIRNIVVEWSYNYSFCRDLLDLADQETFNFIDRVCTIDDSGNLATSDDELEPELYNYINEYLVNLCSYLLRKMPLLWNNLDDNDITEDVIRGR